MRETGVAGYFITKDGKLWSTKTNKFLRPTVHTGGYLKVKIGKPKKDYYMHRLVAYAYLPPIDGKYFVNHKNGNKKDNRVANLEWVTDMENQLHNQFVLKNSNRGSLNGSAKLTEKTVAAIKKRLSRGDTLVSIAKDFHVSATAIQEISCGKKWLHV